MATSILISTALRWILLASARKKFSFYLSNRDQMYSHILIVPVESNGQILCHADARHCIPIHFQQNRKNTQHSKGKTLSQAKAFPPVYKKRFYDFTPKSRSPRPCTNTPTRRRKPIKFDRYKFLRFYILHNLFLYFIF